MITETLLTQSKRLEAEIKSLQAKLQHFPDGKIICAQNEGRYKWYRSDGKHRTYIPKKEHDLAEQLAMKKYLTLRLEECRQEKHAIDLYLRHYPSLESPSRKLLTSSGYRELLAPYFTPDEDTFTSWMNAPFETNPKNPEHLTFQTVSGRYVRSKSESIIDMLLYTNHIPFRYECALSLGGATLYPDFTILHPITGKIIYWEHFGLMDDPGYRSTAHSRLQLYTSHGIIPTIHLITTFETKDNPLSPEYVKKTIQQYFL